MGRPLPTFNDFIGQARTVRFLRRIIAGARERGVPCPHLMLNAPSGAGKTTLAQAIAKEYGTDLHSLFSGEDTRALDVANTLYQLKHADVLFIDEGHSLKRDSQQLLYVALDQEKCPAIIESRLDRGQLQSIASFTLIVATNQPGLIQRGLRSRLSRIELDRYTVPELKVIAERVAMNSGAEITPQAARRLAEAAQGTPRSIYRRIETLSLLYTNTLKFTQDHVEDLLAGEGIDVYGLSPQQRLYLSALAESPQGVCSIERLSIKLGCDAASVRQDLEPYLFEQGFVDPNSSRGRRLTAQGLAVVRELTVAEKATGKEEVI